MALQTTDTTELSDAELLEIAERGDRDDATGEEHLRGWYADRLLRRRRARSATE